MIMMVRPVLLAAVKTRRESGHRSFVFAIVTMKITRVNNYKIESHMVSNIPYLPIVLSWNHYWFLRFLSSFKNWRFQQTGVHGIVGIHVPKVAALELEVEHDLVTVEISVNLVVRFRPFQTFKFAIHRRVVCYVKF